MAELLEMLAYYLSLPVMIMSNATDSLNAIEFDKSFAAEYLGYIKYAMGDTLFMMYSSVALIFGGASLWSFTLKGINFIKELLPMQ